MSHIVLVPTVSAHVSQGRLNQWAPAQGPRIFFLFEGPPTGCGEIKLIILLLMLLHYRTNTSSAYLVNLHTVVHGLFLCCAGILANNGAINAANFLP